MKIIFFTRFNRVFAEDDKTRNRVMQSKAWWKKRLNIYRGTVLRSLANQTDKDFDYVCVFNKNQMEKYPHIKNFMEISSGYIEESNPSTEYEPLELAAQTKEDAIFFNIDSDDHVHKDTVKELKKLKPKEGLTPYMDNGYIYDLNTGKMAYHHAYRASGPFWGIYIPGRMNDVQTIHRYMKDYNMDGHHFQKHKAINSHKLPDNMYLYSVHGDNTTTAWKNYNTSKKVGKKIRAKKPILKNFGYVERKKDN